MIIPPLVASPEISFHLHLAILDPTALAKVQIPSPMSGGCQPNPAQERLNLPQPSHQHDSGLCFFFFSSYYSVTFHQYWKGAGMNLGSSSDNVGVTGYFAAFAWWGLGSLFTKWAQELHMEGSAATQTTHWEVLKLLGGLFFSSMQKYPSGWGIWGPCPVQPPHFLLGGKPVIHSTLSKAHPSFHPPSPGRCCLTHILS